MSPHANDQSTHFPDDVVPSQWMDQVREAFADVPERRLLIALLFDVIRVLHGGGVKERAEISAWIRGTNSARIPFSLLCDALELEPTCLARRLLHGKVMKVSRFRARADKRKAMPPTTVHEPSSPVADAEVSRASVEPENREADPTAAVG
jgi:hypothetical protein